MTRSFRRIISFPLALMLTCLASSSPVHAQVLEQDSLALVAINNNMGGASWTTPWNLSTPISSWDGITVSGNRVTGLNLLNNNLSGALPDSIGDLTALTTLWLGGDPITGSLPATIGNLTNVTGFYIYLTNLSGSIPPEIGDMTSLYALLLESNSLSGPIPAEIGNLTNLYTLKLYDNQLNGAIPPEIGNMTNLGILDLNNNGLTGTIPAQLGNLVNLKDLSLWGNQLSGTIPPEIGSLGSLEKLYLNQNQLTGAIPGELCNLANLEVLSLHQNQLTGSVPSQFGNLSKLKFLQLSGNQLSGAIPAGMGTLPLLNQVHLDDNQFEDLPDFSSAPYLASLYIQNNKFTFEDIEPNMGAATGSFDYSPQANVGQTEYITILENTDRTISVTVGGSVNQYQWLKDGAVISGATSDSYVISNAQFAADDGTYTCRITNPLVPGLILNSYPFNVSLASLATEQDSLALVAIYNALDGPNWTDNINWLVPGSSIDTWSGAIMTNGRVTYLNLANRNLSGSLPAAIGDLTELTSLSFYNNHITGPIPAAIGNLISLQTLELRSNQLTGEIPSSIGDWSALKYLYLGGNQLSGSIPAELGNLTNMTYLWLFDNQLSGTIPAEIGDCSSLTSLYLYNNQLEGAVPYEVTFLSQLKDLHVQDNRLEDLPNLDDLSSLNYLYVQNNRLTFEDIEPNIEVPIVKFTYAPQDSLGSEIDTSVADGAGLTLAVAVGGTANEYQWMKNSVDIAAATSDTLTFSAVQMADAGAYILRITNPLASACTLYTRPMHVTIVDVPPATPQSLMAVTGDRQVTLVWEPNTEGDLLRYRVYGGTSPYPMTVVDSTAATTSTVADLNNGTLYFFRITAVDQAMNESDYSAQISIVPYDRPPVAGMDSATTQEDSPVSLAVLVNDTEIEGSALSIIGITQGAHGTVSINEDNTLTYSPNADFNGTDSFIYLVSNGEEEVAVGTVTITVTPINDAPAAFALLPQASSSITVLPDATGDTVVFAWEAAVDVDGDPVGYHFISTGNLALLGLVDTTVTEIKLAHADVWALMDGAGAATLSGTWTVSATDGVYTVKAGGDPQALTINAGALALEDLPGVLSDFALQQNYPNPFNPSTTIRFDLPEAAEVSLLVYDMLGREVARLVTGQMEAGYHSVTWDGREATGRSVPTGLYIARMVTPAYSHTIRLVLLK